MHHTLTSRPTALELQGVVNGAPVAAVGHGIVEGGAWRELALDALHVPLCWDPALAAPLLIDVATLALAGERESAEPSAQLTAHQVVHDDQGRAVGRAVVAAAVEHGEVGLAIRTQLLHAVFRLEVGEAVARIEFDGRAPVVPIAGGRAFLATAWSFESTRGSRYWGLVTAFGEPFARRPADTPAFGSATLERGAIGATGAWVCLRFDPRAAAAPAGAARASPA